jgi:hypothetical protein
VGTKLPFMGIRGIRKSTALCAAVSAVAMMAASAIPAQAATSPWRQVYNKHYGVAANDSVYGAVVATSANNAWALGGSDGSYGDRTVQLAEAVHWNGKSWSSVAMPSGAKGWVDAASAPAANDIWAVTNEGGYILHYNGKSWAVEHHLSGASRLLTSVVAFSATNVWVFGTSGEGPGYGTWHYNGKTWSAQTGTAGDVDSASAVSATNLWAIANSSTAPATSIARYNGKSWSRVSNSALSGLSFNRIQAISASSVWITASAPDNGFKSYLLHYNGHTFSKTALPWSVGVSSVVSDGANGVWLTAGSMSGQQYMVHYTSKGAWSRTAVGADFDSLAHIPGGTAEWAGGFKPTSSGNGVIWAYGKV